jgi:hypothetical protein
MYHYYFIERNSGEEFIVGADTLEEAWKIADEVAAAIRENYDEGAGFATWMCYEYEMTEEEAEASGLDEY